MKNAKTASKNNPSKRAGSRKFFWNGEEVTVVVVYGPFGKLKAAASVKTGDIMVDSSENIIEWSKVVVADDANK